MTRWLRATHERPGLVLLGVAALTFALLAGLVDLRTGVPRLGVNPAPDNLFPESGPERELYERSRRLFGSDEPIVVVLGADDIFSEYALERVIDATRRLEAVDGVKSVSSLATVAGLVEKDGDLDLGPFLVEVPRDEAERLALREAALRHPIYAGTLVARDGRATALLVSIEAMSDRELIESRLDPRIVAAAEAGAGDLDLWITGGAHLKVLLSESIVGEMAVMMPTILAILGAVLFISMRTVRGVVLPLITIVIGLVWTLGTLGWLGQELNLVTGTVPALILTIGFTYALHVVSDYDSALKAHAGESVSSRQLVERTVDEVGLPVLVTGVTTAAGFLALAMNPVGAIREFGLYSLLAVGFTVLASLTFVPALLAVLPVPRRREGGPEFAWLERAAAHVGDFSIRNRRAVLLTAAAVVVVSIAGIPSIRVAVEFPGVFAPDAPIRRDFEAINERLGGAREIRVLIEGDRPKAFLDPANLQEIAAFQTWLEAQPEIDTSTSIVDYLEVLHRALVGEGDGEFRVPDSRPLVSQLLLFGASPETNRFVDMAYQTANVLVGVRVADSDDVEAVVQRVRDRLAEFPPRLTGDVTGTSVLLGRVVDDISRGQFLSISVAFVLIYVVLVILFTSFRVGLLALFPNVLPIAVYFGALGFAGFTLNPSTSLLGCLVLGIAVDDTIHFFARFNADARRGADEAAGARTALAALIRPVTFTSIGLCLGFLVLTMSEQSSQAEFGLLASITIAVAWACDVTLNPALCSGVRIVTLWDVLRLDLGNDPQNEIALFNGLSGRQARIFALMSEVRPFVAGERIITKGEAGKDLFLIIHGRLLAWLEGDGQRVELSTMERGAVVGEVGHFSATRSANVDALEDGSMVCFDADDLERLRRRYPRIAALVYRNLNRVQAARLARNTELMH